MTANSQSQHILKSSRWFSIEMNSSFYNSINLGLMDAYSVIKPVYCTPGQDYNGLTAEENKFERWLMHERLMMCYEDERDYYTGRDMEILWREKINEELEASRMMREEWLTQDVLWSEIDWSAGTDQPDEWPSENEVQTVSSAVQNDIQNENPIVGIDMGGYRQIPPNRADEVLNMTVMERKRLFSQLMRQEDPNYETGSESD